MIAIYNLSSFLERQIGRHEKITFPFRSFLKNLIVVKKSKPLSLDKAMDIPILLTFACIPLHLTLMKTIDNNTFLPSIEVFFVFLLYPIFKMIYDESSTRSFESYTEMLSNFRLVFSDFSITVILLSMTSTLAKNPAQEILNIFLAFPFLIYFFYLKEKQGDETDKLTIKDSYKDSHRSMIYSSYTLGDLIHKCGFMFFASSLITLKLAKLIGLEREGLFYYLGLAITLFFLFLLSNILIKFVPTHSYEAKFKIQPVCLSIYLVLFLSLNYLWGLF